MNFLESLSLFLLLKLLIEYKLQEFILTDFLFSSIIEKPLFNFSGMVLF